jgi:hypothetical protein
MFWLAFGVGVCNGWILWSREYEARRWKEAVDAAQSMQNQDQYD